MTFFPFPHLPTVLGRTLRRYKQNGPTLDFTIESNMHRSMGEIGMA